MAGSAGQAGKTGHFRRALAANQAIEKLVSKPYVGGPNGILPPGNASTDGG